MFEDYLDIHEVREIRSRALVYFGCGAIQKMADIAQQLTARGIRKVLITSTPTAYRVSGAWEPVTKALEAAGVEYLLYNQVTPNPETEMIDEATRLGREFGAGAVMGIGGGSPIDTAKSVAILLAYPDQNAEALYEYRFTPEKALPIIAVNLTHGTGSEGNRVAVASVLSKQYKPAIAYECLYPTWSIDDPELMLTLPEKQILYTTIDAVNHVVEAATTTCTNPFAISLARETIQLIADWLPVAMQEPQNLSARYHLAYAALLAGISFDNGFLHLTHALEHPLSSMKPAVTHGLGLSILLPSVVKSIYPARGAVLADILAPIVPNLTGEVSEAAMAGAGIEKWMADWGADRKLVDEGFTEADIDPLVHLTFTTPSLPVLLSVSPVPATRELVQTIYQESLRH
ncbi:MAG: iron-containing alcohol dehydrogenase [Planctomycetia bacterium]|nr:iron-containing alcohol dehydrogenase [Planctomycetia bacterium]